jgi:F0F1-type ATP synthase membrane subunit a
MSILSHTMPTLADQLTHVMPHFFGEPEGAPPPKFGFSNHILMMCIAAALAMLVFTYVGAKARTTLVPRGMHNFFESILSFLRTELIRPALGANADRFTPFIWTVFFFILFCNLLGLIPLNEIATTTRYLVEKMQHGDKAQIHEYHFWGTATANFSMTGGLAIVAFFAVHISGIIQQVRIKMDPSLAPHHHGNDHAPPHGHGQSFGLEGIEDERDVVLEHRVGDGHDHAHGVHHSQEFGGQPFPVAVVTGIGSYIWNFAPHPEMGWKVIELVMFGALFVLELAGSIVKPFSLCVRLFANMVAGHLVLASLVGMIPFAMAVYAWGPIGAIVVAGCTALSMLELFVAFLQAYIFAFLTTLFIASAVAPEH